MSWFEKHLGTIFERLRFVLIVLICVFLVSADYGCAFQDVLVNDDWPMYKFNVERTGATSNFDFDSIALLWKYEYDAFEQGGGSRVSPAISADRVLVPTRRYINCLNTDNGELMWRRFIDENYSSPVIYQGNVIISSPNAINSFSIKNGFSLWSINLAKEKEYVTAASSVPAVFDGKIYYGLCGKGDSEGYLYCLNISDGSTVWTYRTNGIVQTSPLVTNGKVIFGSDDGSIHCLDASSGNSIWTYYTKDVIRSSPAVYNNKVFAGSNDAYVYCLDIEDGTLIWKYKTGDKVTATPAISYGTVVVSSSDKYVYCLDIDSGKLMWKRQTGDSIYTSPAVCGSKILLGFEKSIYCLNARDGNLLWSFALDDLGISTPFAVDNGRLYFRTTRFIYCFTLN